MYPRATSHLRKQRGFLVPLSAVLVVGIGVLALTISRITSQANQSSVLEGLSLQAFYAAESGAQSGLSLVLFDVANRASANGNCTGLSQSIDFTAQGLAACEAQVTCSFVTDAGDTTSFYTIQSAASCGSGDLVAERTIQVTAYL